jgi:hypothetical protein
MSEIIQEYVDSGRQRLGVDREAGIIRGVKLLGLSSRNGRRYLEGCLVEATSLYEGAKVNINHPKGHPLSPRDYQDRLGMIRGVQFRAGEGLFGDLHFNPKHALSEQLIWDAEHAPQNVGLSHNVLARTSRQGDETVIEAVTKVQSIDLVADPATTDGLFEHANQELAAATDPARPALEWDALTVSQLELHRPDLIQEIRDEAASQVRQLREQLDQASALQAASERRTSIEKLLEEFGLPMPSVRNGAPSRIVSEQFIQELMSADSDAAVRRAIQERAELVRSARAWSGKRPRGGDLPRSRDQSPLHSVNSCRSAAEFAAAVRER